MSEIPDSILTEAREAAGAIVDRMCGTYRHDYGLLDDEARKALRGTFSKIAYHDVAPAIARAIMEEREFNATQTAKMLFAMYAKGR